MPNNTWILTADASRARILQVAGRDRLEEVVDLVNPKGRMNGRELTTDAYPRLRGINGAGGDRQEMPAAEHEVELFSKQLGRYLDKARIEHRYDRLYLVAPPKMLGMIRKELGKEVEKLVKDEFDKDLSWLSAQEIERYLSAKGSAPRL